MSLALLLEKYDVSTDEGLQKAIGEIEKEELEVDDALSGALRRSTNLEGRLRTASQAYTKLGEMRADAQSAADMVERTAALARDVSAKVRQLDLARSRVAECQRRVHDLIDLQLCTAGVEAAIQARDYETGACHVARFLSMDPGSVAAARARGAPDPRQAMTRAAGTLREHLVRKFEEAARREDEPALERLFKLFPQLGHPDEGVHLLATYLAAQLESKVGRVCKVEARGGEGGGAVFADALTRLLEAGGAAVERARHWAAAAGGPGALPRACSIIQPTVCAGARRVYGELRVARRLPDAPTDPRRAGGARDGGSGPAPPPSLAAVEHTLAELALSHSRIRLYFAFLRRKAEADAGGLEAARRQAALDAMETLIGSCDLMRTAQDLLAHYLSLERYFLEESVSKALKLSTPAPGATSSSLVDDVFFIARKVIRRSLSTGSVDGACAVLNDVAALLERDVAGALRRYLRAPPPDPLPLPAPRLAAPAPPPLAGMLAQRLNRDVDAQRQLFLVHMTEAESGAEWSERLAAEACAGAEPLHRAAGDRDKLHSCAAGLAAAAAAFRAAGDLALAGLEAALKPRVHAWADALADPDIDPDEVEEDADALPGALDVLAESARAALPPAAAEHVLLSVVSEVCARSESRLRAHTYRREGGLAVERRARRLAAWAGGGAGGARERCARLTQAAALLSLEHPSHAPDALLPTPRLAPHEAKDILTRRSDFKMEDIKRLKL